MRFIFGWIVLMCIFVAAFGILVSPLAVLLWWGLKASGLHLPFLAVWAVLTVVAIVFGKGEVRAT